MAHTFSVTLPKGMDLVTGVEKVRTGVINAGGKYQFDGTNGRFEIKGVVGTFTVSGVIVTITIVKKPWVVTNGYVEATIRKLFAQAS